MRALLPAELPLDFGEQHLGIEQDSVREDHLDIAAVANACRGIAADDDQIRLLADRDTAGPLLMPRAVAPFKVAMRMASNSENPEASCNSCNV